LCDHSPATARNWVIGYLVNLKIKTSKRIAVIAEVVSLSARELIGARWGATLCQRGEGEAGVKKNGRMAHWTFLPWCASEKNLPWNITRVC